MKKERLSFFVIFIVILAIALIAIIYYNKTPESPLKSLEKIREENKLVTGNGIFVDIKIDKGKIDNLKNHSIKYLFINLGDLELDGSFQASEQEIRKFIGIIDEYEKEKNYDFILLPYSKLNAYKFSLSSKFLGGFVNSYKNLVGFGFDGVLLDVDPVRIGQEADYIDLIELLSLKIPKGKILSVSAGTVDGASKRSNEGQWTLEFFKNVSGRVDLIVVPAYNLHFNSKNEYKNEVNRAMEQLSLRNMSSKFLLGVPTNKQEPEIVGNALEVYNSRAEKGQFIGVSIFSERTTDEEEWKTFDINTS